MQSHIRQNRLIGIDVGTTVLKAAAFDVRSGVPIAFASRRLTVRTASGGVREQSVVSLDRALSSVLKDLRGDLTATWRNVSGIGLAAQGGSTIIADRRTGKALTPMMLWNDKRAIGFSSTVKDRTSVRFWRNRTLRDDPGAGLSRLLWLRKKHPKLLSDSNILVGAGEYCFFHLTGEWRQDAGNALQIGCYNAGKRRIDQDLFDLVGMPISFVAPMRSGHETHSLVRAAADRLGLREGISVAGPYMDHEAGYMSAIGVSKRPLQVSLGTAWVGNFTLSSRSKWVSPFQLVLPAPVGRGSLVVQPLLTGNVAWDWALGRFLDRDHAKALRRAAMVFSAGLLPSSEFTAIPWLSVPNAIAPRGVPGACAYADDADNIRGMAVSQVCELMRVLGAVIKKRKVDSIVLGGGASKGEFFRTLIAALVHPLPVFHQCEDDIAGPRGTLLAFSEKTARAKTRRVRVPAAGARRDVARVYEQYVDLFDKLYGKVPIAERLRFLGSALKT